MGFGKSKQKSNNQSQQTSQSLNQAFPFLKESLGGQVSNLSSGSSAVASLLGLNGSPAQMEGLQRFKDSSGYNFIRDETLGGVNSNAAAKRLLASGSTIKGLADRSNNLASTFLDKYLSNVLGFANTGTQAAQILAGAGNTANSQGTSFGTSSGSNTNFGLG